MWTMNITGPSISNWLPCPVPSWVPGTYGGNTIQNKQIIIIMYGHMVILCALCNHLKDIDNTKT